MRGDFAVGKSFDTDYLKNFANSKQTYVKNVLWHHKSFFFRIKDTENNFPYPSQPVFSISAQWEVISTNPVNRQATTIF